ncbi:conserved hypothetical protein [Methylobacterium nodulans ORS 2060]|uniref:Transposase n=2 Tax=Methylobacterium nodulans (strain LMG 21967 / CNCM I-2342 / ORS 2060) TaxID=460265 RepID=B8IAL6_METNO|nr:conserved hypothetical protein [Methylobacterium nodulans ORS 2060]
MMAALRAERARRAREAEAARIAHDAERIRARCTTLQGFVREAWHVLEPRTSYVHGWHIDAICDHLTAVTRGDINRLLINVPPGSSKSLLASVLWQAWEWGPAALPSLRYLATAFNDIPVKRDTRKVRDLILSDWYRALWPEVQLTRAGETSFANTRTGSREGVPFGSLTSQRGDRLIIDDPHSTKTAESPAERSATTRLFREGAVNRLNDQEQSAIVVIMQRLHEDDISGTILKQNMGYVHLCLPMEFEAERRCVTAIGFRDPRQRDGELLDPKRFPRTTVEQLQNDMGSYAYAGQYQQRPAPREGGLFKRHWFGLVKAPPAGCDWVRGWDLAASEARAGSERVETVVMATRWPVPGGAAQRRWPMPSALSVDLRQRVVSAVAEGASCHQAAARFGVSVASVSRWSRQQEGQGDVTPKPMGGDQRSQRIEAHAELILQTYQAHPQSFLHELCETLQEQGVPVSRSSLSRFFARHRITRKKGRRTQLSRSGRM